MENKKCIFDKALRIGDKIAQLPIIQGGMGVGVSLSSLAGAVAAEGGVGIISTAQIGYEEPGFHTNPQESNLIAIKKHIQKAKELARGKGLVGVNVMVALKQYREHVKAAVAAGADLIVCGAGIPDDLPELVGKESGTKIAPIVSSKRAAELLMKIWDKRYHRTPDLIVIEGPKAGGHLGFSREQLADLEHIDFDTEVKNIIKSKEAYEEKYQTFIPVVVGGGIYDQKMVAHMKELGADGVQVATRFVATQECDASDAYKNAYVNATEADIAIVQSPVGMPGRALRNAFIKRTEQAKEKISKCYQCITPCKPAEVPYCITEALVKAVKGDVDNGLVFCGANVEKIKEITTVHEVISELIFE